MDGDLAKMGMMGSIDFNEESVQKELRDKNLLESILNNKNVKVDLGENMDLNHINIDHDYIPETKCFRVFRFQNEKTKRRIRVMKCDFEGCNMIFRSGTTSLTTCARTRGKDPSSVTTRTAVRLSPRRRTSTSTCASTTVT